MTSIFCDKLIVPTDEMVKSVLLDNYTLWETLYSFLKEEYHAFGEWKFYSKKSGWSYSIKSGKRTLLYFIPKDGYFLVTFVLGEKAVNKAQKADLPKDIIDSINESKKYVEGRSCMVNVQTINDIKTIKILVKIKVEN